MAFIKLVWTAHNLGVITICST